MPVQQSLAGDASSHKVDESSDGIFALQFLTVGIDFREHGDS